MIRPVTLPEIPRLADFLDRRTLANRWLVAFFRHFPEIPPESAPLWGFWTDVEDSGSDPEPRYTALIAHHFRNGVSYAVLEPGFDAPAVEALLSEDALPERLIGDGPSFREWEIRSPAFFSKAAGREDLAVLELPPTEPGPSATAPSGSPRDPCAGFRSAGAADEPILRELEILYARELGEDEVESDVDSLIARGLSFVIEEEGRVAGSVRSNLSDGRYVHAGGLYVHPRFRGRGLGVKLLLGLCARVHQEGSTLILTADRSNRPAMAAYRAAGFREVGSGVLVRFTEDAWRREG